jgi:hypothetical protein
MELVSLAGLSKATRVGILKELGYESNGTFIIDKSGKELTDPFTHEPIKIDNMLIVPGSELILDNNPLSVASYFEEHGELI